MIQLSKNDFNSDHYWEQRYTQGMFSGCGSIGMPYRFKRDVINAIIRKFQFKNVVDFGCGDGWQIQELEVPNYYGLDVSPTVIKLNRWQYASRPHFRFDLVQEAKLEHYDLAMSIDVVYHVIRQAQYEEYLRMIFAHSNYTLLYGNYHSWECEAEHMLMRDHFAEIERLAIPTTLLGKYPMPERKLIGFALFGNWKEDKEKKIFCP